MFGRTPTEKAWQELKRHRQQMKEDSSRIIDEIGRLEREVGALQARLEAEQVSRAAHWQEAAATAPRIAIGIEIVDDPPDSALDLNNADNGTINGTVNGTVTSTGQAETDVIEADEINTEQLEAEAFDSFFTVADSELDKERRFLLD